MGNKAVESMRKFLKTPIPDEIRKEFVKEYSINLPEGSTFLDALNARYPEKHVKEKLKL